MPERLLIGPGSPPSLDPVYPELSPPLEPCRFWGRKESGSGLLTVSDPGLILPESACRWPQVFHTQGIRLCPMTLFNPVFNCLTPIVIKRSKTQAEEGLGPQPKAGDTSRRSWLCRSASAPSQQACEPVQDRCSGPCSRPRHAAAWRSRKRAPAGWVAVEATSRPRQFGYETPQFRLERRLHAGSPYRSNDLVSAGPEPPLSCDLRLNHAGKRTQFSAAA